MILSPYDEVRNLIMTLVSADQINGRLLTSEVIESHVENMSTFFINMRGVEFGHSIDKAALLRDIEASCNVYIPNANVMEGDDDHLAWLTQARGGIEWKFWNRYHTYLSTVNRMPPAAVERLDDITDMVLDRLESPVRAGAWDRRGLVAGHVQSGKTGNYIGLICKAIDSGYKLVIVLAGIHNSLRAQTQTRVDEGVLGFSTEQALRSEAAGAGLVGVGKLAGQYLHVSSFTSRKQSGDFSLRVAEQVGVKVGAADPVVLVVKKNKSVLTNVLKWATSISAVADPESGRQIVRKVPLLVIDDEADQASVDTNGPRKGADDNEYSPTVINGLVREILDKFEQSSYVGYTATPFANIFIDPDIRNDAVGEGLFPRSFILSLPSPSTYVGASRVFGLKEDIARNIEYQEPLPMVRHVPDYESWIPDQHNKNLIPGDIPQSLREAILAFVLTCAIRRWRGQREKHNSMLVHVTRFVNVQKHVRDQVREELGGIQVHLRLGRRLGNPVWGAAQKLFETDFEATSGIFARFEDLEDQQGPMPSWEQLAPELSEAADSIGMKLINGSASDALDYVDHPDGINAIVVGGAKLSRGLTLEGLSISYYLRGSRMYDTLMQMGRWFGYRPGYLDLCRLYTTRELERWYAMITESSEELYREFDYMVAIGSTPREFGLRVQQHPDGLMVTSPNRMRSAKLITMSFAGNISETILFKTAKLARERNWEALATLVRMMKSSGSVSELPRNDASSNYVWSSVPASFVIEFLDKYVGHEDAYKVQPQAMREYINNRVQDDPPELTDWWVLLANSSSPLAEMEDVAGLPVGLTVRSRYPKDADGAVDATRYSIRRLVSPPHERIDMPSGSQEYAEALKHTQDMWRDSPRKDKGDEAPTTPAGIACRRVRTPSRGLLLLYPIEGVADGEPLVGMAVSFPDSDRAKPQEYQVTKDAWIKIHQAVSEEDPVDDDDDDGDGVAS